MPVINTEQYNRSFRPNIVNPHTGEPELPEEWDFEAEPEWGELDEEEMAARRHEMINVSPSQFVEFAVKIPDKKAHKHVPFSFEGRRYLRLPYDTQAKRTLYKCGRQVEKSTLLGNKCLAYACINNSLNILYVSPTNQQTKVFSQDRLKEPIETSDTLKAWTTTKLSDSVFLKKFINRSQITLRYAYHSADRVRGIPADLICIDEFQDIITDNIPIIEECASHSPFKLFTYSGTPKSYDNAIEKYWTQYSTQNEWVVPCHRHTTTVGGVTTNIHWNILGESNIERRGLVCDKCRQPISPTDPSSQWAAMNPGVWDKLKDAYDGYRIPQLMVPWIEWAEIMDKYEKYPRYQFYNEVLGQSFDSGTRPLTRQDIIDNCDPRIELNQEGMKRVKEVVGGASPVYAGIDWGTGEGSFTVMSLGTYIGGKFTIFYVHQFRGQEIEPPVQLDAIERLIRQWDVKLVGVDYGGGFDRNDHLARRFGKMKIVKYQYSQPGQKVKWEDGLFRYLVHRTEVMSDIFNAIKRKDVFRFPKFEHFEDPFGKDFLNIFSEYNEQQRQVQYKKSPDSTDDTFHSVLLCFLASLIQNPRPDVLNPMAKTSFSSADDY